MRIEYRWADGDADLAAGTGDGTGSLGSRDVILARQRRAARSAAKARHAPSRSFSRMGGDPVGAGLVASLARPGGNVTGFTQFEYAA